MMRRMLERLGTIAGGVLLVLLGIGLAAVGGTTRGLVIGGVMVLVGLVLILIAAIAAGVAWGNRDGRGQA